MSYTAYHLSQLILNGPKTTYLLVAQNTKEAIQFKKNLEFYLGSFAPGTTAFFPAHDVLPFSNLSPHNEVSCERLKTLFALLSPSSPAFLATTIAAIDSKLPPKELLHHPLSLKKGDVLDRTHFIQKISEWGYQHVPVVIDRGHFAIRGSLLDVFSPLHPHPLRIEWFDDTIESLREFDPDNQKTIRHFDTTENATLIPVREVILSKETCEIFSKKIREMAEEKDLPKPQWFPLLEKVRGKIFFPGIESYLELFYSQPTRFEEWLPSNTIQLPLPSASDFSDTIHTHEEIRREIEKSRKSLEPLAPLAKRIQSWVSTDAVFIVASSHHQAERISDLLTPYLGTATPILSSPFNEILPQRGQVRIILGELSSGFRLPQEGLTLITEDEIFGQKTRHQQKSEWKGKGLSSFAELKIGDPLVHKEQGIGLYQGLVHMVIEGIGTDFLIVEYQGGDKLYLPVYRMNLVQRYKGADGKTPKLDKMGGTSWTRIKGKAEKAIRELAGELLNLYAARTSGKGFAFSPPNELFEAFEASFPFDETPDQEKAIQEVLEDMQKEKPMDRLVLGDVGYGKTEVALRAAFKAVIDGKQVAFLVPTTLLAFQHYERFLERFRDYPVKIEMISRFRSASEQKKILADTAAGKIDILVGTHRLFQPDISFKDLGLLIIDEEHRFGVEHKEKIKRFRKNVDVLALSATPIPRTLYMSLVGIRGISVIETPPVDRLSIRTFVMPFETSIIHESIARELKRGGQIFFLHNEIETIGRMKAFLHELLPGAKIEIAHGQMDEKILEETMINFFHQKFDILLCTTIIESGIDIPTANTIIINNADGFGLSQIYQLRGRVGRGSHRAYAYLLITPEKNLTPEALKRLDVLQRFSDLGSGYKIASYDLEIRGAGNLLGTSQSGHMEAIGYELYTELLENAVKELKGEKILEEIDPELHFRLPAFLPEDYVPDPPVRLELYRRLASLSEEDELDPIQDEIEDRFGLLPTEVENLLELSLIKIFSKKLRIRQIRYDGKTFAYSFDPSSPLDPNLLLQKIKKSPKIYRLTPDMKFIVLHPLPKEDLALNEAKKFLRELTLHL